MTQENSHLSSEGRPLIERIGSLLSPPVVFCAVVVGFLSSVVLGNLSTHNNMFRDFVRIHQLIGTESLFNVSALEIYRLLEDVPASKILVIVGGTSRFNGAGQTPKEIWSGHLQERLGPDYAVVNLALRAGTADQGGAHAAEAMIKAGRRVLYVADWSANAVVPVGGTQPQYRYFFYDWLLRDLLLDSPFRDRGLEEFESRPDGAAAPELRLRSRLNRWLYFDDLWTHVGYRWVFFAAWHSLLRPNPFAARAALPDPEENLPEDCCYRFHDFEQALRTARIFASAGFKEDYLDRAGEWSRIIPIPLRDRSLIVWIAISPFYTDHLSAEERSQYAANMIAAAESLRRAGFQGIEVGRDWAAGDFIDQFHISEKGGRKLVDAIAPLVTQMAQDLGYVR